MWPCDSQIPVITMARDTGVAALSRCDVSSLVDTFRKSERKVS